MPEILVRRVFSLSGVFPLGAFLVVHILANASALRGESAFDATVRALHGVPLRALVETLVVFAPLALHAAIGIWLTVTRRPLAQPSPYPNGVRVAMRVTGVLVLAFLAMHLPEIRFRAAPGGHDGHEGATILTVLAADLSSTWRGVPWRGVAYLAGTGCVTFHFAAGLWGFVVGSWHDGGEPARRARLIAAWSAAFVGASLWFAFADIVVLHATGARVVGEAADEAVPTGPCPP